MNETNRLDKVFGATGTSAGIFLFIAGLIVLFFYISGLILMLLGAFIGFTSTSTLVDYDHSRIRFSNNIFGFIPVGKWIKITDEMTIGIRKSEVTWRTYSRSNQALDIDETDYRLFLFDADGQPILPVKKTATIDLALTALEEECKKLGLSTNTG